MNKQNLIIGIVVLIALVGGVVLWNQKNNQQDTKQQTKKEVAEQTQKQEIAKEKNNQGQNQKQEVNKKQEENQEQGTKHLSPEEIEKFKKEKDLVWYEIPELGIKFKVAPEIKDDLIYKKINDKVYLCDKHLGKFLSDNVGVPYVMPVSDNDYRNCSQGYIFKTTSEKIIDNGGSQMCSAIVGHLSHSNIICFVGRQDPLAPRELMIKYTKTIGKNHQGISKNIIGNHLQEIN